MSESEQKDEATAPVVEGSTGISDSVDKERAGTVSSREKRRLEQNRIRAREARKRDKAKCQQMQEAIFGLTRENQQLKLRNKLLVSELSMVLQAQGAAPPQQVSQVLGLPTGVASSVMIPQLPVIVQQPSLIVQKPATQNPVQQLCHADAQQYMGIHQMEKANPNSMQNMQASSFAHVAQIPADGRSVSSAGVHIPASVGSDANVLWSQLQHAQNAGLPPGHSLSSHVARQIFPSSGKPQSFL